MAITGYYHLSPTGGGLKNGLTWANAFDEAAFEAFIEGGGLAAGNVVFIKEGTYTLDSAYNSSAIGGTNTSPIAFIGVLAGTTNEGAAVVYADWARAAASKPFFDCATFGITLGARYVIRNISFQGSGNLFYRPGVYCVTENCKFDNDVAVSTNQYFVYCDQLGLFVNCEFSAANCRGVQVEIRGSFYYCYFHDFTDATHGVALYLSSSYHNVVGCVFDNIQTIAILSAGTSHHIVGCTFYETDVAVSGGTSAAAVDLNNICEGNDVDGFKWATQTDINVFWGNHGGDARCTDMWDGVDTTTVFQDYKVSTGDPLFTAAGTDFSIGQGSPCMATAEDIALGVGATVKHGNKGAWQGITDWGTFPTAAQTINSLLKWGHPDQYGPGEVAVGVKFPVFNSPIISGGY